MATAKNSGKLKISGHKELAKAFKKASEAGRKAAKNALETLSESIAEDAASRAPVDEGDLSENIIYRLAYDDTQGIVYVVGPAYPIAAHGHLVEFGTVNMDAQPFLRPAVDGSRRLVADDLAKALKRGLKLG